MSDADPYLDPKTGVLRNRFGLTDASRLDEREREWTVQRISEGCPAGDFDLAHLQGIHRHIFQDIYDWAGQLRTVELSKNGDQFQASAYIRAGMADVHARLVAQRFLKAMNADAFASEAAKILGDVNYVHRFREGNGHTQLQYLLQLGRQAGHEIAVSRLKAGWIAASRTSHQGDYEPMAREIAAAIVR